MNVLKYFGVLPGEPVLADAVISPKRYRFKAVNSGIWHGFHELGQRVKKGELVGEITDLFGNVLERYDAPEDAKVTFLRTFYSVNQGEALIGLTVL
jgi:predicted deacylase